MRTQVIPAQITTVEDKIVGNLNLTQLFILISPILVITGVYAFLPPTMKIVSYKVSIFIISIISAIALSLRIKGKVVINWLGILFTYNLRSKYYVYNKNEPLFREMALPHTEKKRANSVKMVSVDENKEILPKSKIKELASFENLLDQNEVDFRYKTGKKGGINVAFDQIKR